MKKIVSGMLMCIIVLLHSGCGAGDNVEVVLEQAEAIVEEQTGQNVEAEVKVGIQLGLLAVSINNQGEIEVAVVAETPTIPTPLGSFSAFVEGSMQFPQKQTLTMMTANNSWIYDLEGRPFAVDLVNVDATVRGDGTGNLVIEFHDAQANSGTEPRFKHRAASDIAVYAADIPITTDSIGQSANGQDIEVTRLGSGAWSVVLVGGFHAGFAPASVELAEGMIDYFQTHPEQVPRDVSLYIVPLANPDSQGKGVGQKNGRLNGNSVDINRNWDCNWSETAVWRSTSIDAGAYPFSEPENQALRDFFLEVDPAAVIFWEARGELVIPGRCNGYHSDSQRLASVYGANSDYQFGFITGYQVTGDVADWLDTQGIAAISILLSDYTSADWRRNLRGVQDVLQDVAR